MSDVSGWLGKWYNRQFGPAPTFPLLPCPFCGGRATAHACGGEYRGVDGISAGCGRRDTCGAHGPYRLTLVAAAKAWNKRLAAK